METKTLELQGYRDQPVPNRFHRQRDESHHLALVLPGYGYSCDMPLLYYTVTELLNLGADVLQVEYDYVRQPEYQSMDTEERLSRLLTDVTAAYRLAVSGRIYRQITVVGKSLGTRAMPHLLSREIEPEHVRAIWFTPLWQDSSVRDFLLRGEVPALAVIGTADPVFDAATAEAVSAALQGELLVIEGAEHALEVPGDVVQSVRVLEHAMRAVHRFLMRQRDVENPAVHR